jgi:DNA-binding MarR family transcriptional regulator
MRCAEGTGMHAMLFGLKRGYYAGLRYARRVLLAFGLTPARFDLMFAVREHGWHLQSELRRILGVAGPTVSRMLKSLEKLGLICRQTSPNDAREKIVQLTEEGGMCIERAAHAVIGSGCAEAAMSRAAMGERPNWSFRRGMLAVQSLEEALVRVRRGFGDGAQLLYTHSPYPMGWVPERTKAAELYDPSLYDPPIADLVNVPEWPQPDVKPSGWVRARRVFGWILAPRPIARRLSCTVEDDAVPLC